MKAHDLAKILLKGNNLEVVHIWDGAAHTNIEHVWETSNGKIATADNNEVVYYDEDRPVGSPSQQEDEYWRTPIGG